MIESINIYVHKCTDWEAGKYSSYNHFKVWFGTYNLLIEIGPKWPRLVQPEPTHRQKWVREAVLRSGFLNGLL